MARPRRVVLFHPRTLHERNYSNYWIPYSVLTVGSALRGKGYDVRVIDDNREGLGPEGVLDRVRGSLAEPPLLVGISAMIGHQIEGGLAFAKAVREAYPQSPLVWGGPAPTLLPERFMESPLVDIVVRGTGELPAVAIAEALCAGTGLERLAGVWHREGQNVRRGFDPPRLPRERIGDIQFDLLPVQEYLRSDPHISSKVINYVSSIGCPFGCGFCSETAMYRRGWSADPSPSLCETIGRLLDQSGADGLKLYDANFFVDKRRVLSFADWLGGERPELHWAASAHPRNLATFDDQELRSLHDSGCTRILIGAESGNDDELRYINKDITAKEVHHLAERLNEASIHGSFTFIVGYPGFPEEYAGKTLEFGARLAAMSPLHEVKAHVYAPYPGTPLFQDALRYGFRPPSTLQEWADYDYYETQTPWTSEETSRRVREFNERYCPYIL